DIGDVDLKPPVHLSNDALFQLPFISLCILMISKGRVKPRTQQIGNIVGSCIEGSIPGYKSAKYNLSWSANLRMRTAKALSFLEQANLVEVDRRTNKILSTALGNKVIKKAVNEYSSLALSLKMIEREYRNLTTEWKLEQDIYEAN
ncbi:hypothetical protein, partial [Photobacterium sanguinicancri]